MATLTPYQVSQAIIDCVYAAIDHDGAQEINRKGVVIGDIAWDNCQCGQLVIAEQRRFPSRAFPLEEVDHEAECGEPWIVISLLLSLTRCVPVPDANGNPPTIAALATAAAQLSEDMGKTRPAVFCCLSALYDSFQLAAFELGAMEVTGPAGQCAGFDMTILLGYVNDCGC